MSTTFYGTIGVYSGSFDPLTKGHMWVIEQGIRMFEEFHVTIGPSNKSPMLSFEDRLEMLESALKSTQYGVIVPQEHITAESYLSKLKRPGVEVVILRGIRNKEDFEYEQKIDHFYPSTNRAYVISPKRLDFVSSSEVKKEIAANNWKLVETYVPPIVLEKLKKAQFLEMCENNGHTEFTSPTYEEPSNLRTMRTFFEKIYKNDFIGYAETITADQVRSVLDPYPYDVCVSETFHLCRIDIKNIKVEKSGRYLPCSLSLGPIIVDVERKPFGGPEEYGAPLVIEGKHRMLDAIERGDDSILAWVGQKAISMVKVI